MSQHENDIDELCHRLDDISLRVPDGNNNSQIDIIVDDICTLFLECAKNTFGVKNRSDTT